ncbi:MAG: alpha/beta fold hydrolase [Victivallales bacterium]|nr:alpha/beta fold hydrolase [Victivallales bacterium]
MKKIPHRPGRSIRTFRRYQPTAETDNGDIVIMVHGLIRRGRCMSHLGRRLCRAGYTVYLYDYPSTRKRIAAHGKDLLVFMDDVAAESSGKRLHFVTHSMGGIITREALALLSARKTGTLPTQDIGRIVMLAPPNHGSDIARKVVRLLPFSRRLIKPLEELSSAPDAYIHRVPVPPPRFAVGVIAGKFDGKVSLPYTRLDGMKDHVVINAAHSFIMYRRQAKEQILHFLREMRFRH